MVCMLQIQDLAEEGTWTLFVETLSPESTHQRLQHFDKDSKFWISMYNSSQIVKLVVLQHYINLFVRT